MKYLRAQSWFISPLMVVLMIFWQVTQPLQAATVYWDLNGGTAGAGGAAPSGTWDAGNLVWNPLGDGSGTTAAWTAGNLAAFSAGGDATGIYSITVAGTQNMGGLLFRSGNVSLSGGTLTLAKTGAFDVVSGLTASVGSALTGSAGLGKTGTGTLILSGANTGFSGPVFLGGGITSISAATNLGDGSATNILAMAGGTLQATGSFDLGVNRGPVIGMGDGFINVTGANTLTLNGALAVAGGLTGAVTLTKTGPGTLTLSGTNSAAAINTVIAGGVLSIASNVNLGSGRVTLNGGGLQSTGSSTLANGINLGAAGGTIAVAAGQTLQTGALITGPGSLTKTDTGTLRINIASTYAGATTVSGGILQAGIAASLPAGTTLSVESGAAFDINALAVTVASLGGAGTINNSSTTTNVLTLGNTAGAQNTTFTGGFTSATAGNMTLVKTAGGTLTIATPTANTGNNTGAWTLNAGTVNIDYTVNGSATANMLTSRAMTLQGGNLQVTGRSGATVAQGLGAITIGARGSQIILVPSGGTLTTLSLGTLIHVTTAGASLLINAPANTALRTTTTTLTNGIFGGRYVYTDGAAYDWATNNGVALTNIKGLGTYTAQYSALSLSTDTTADTNNSLLTGSGTLTVGTGTTRTTNTLKLLTSGAGQSLDLNGNNLVLTAGGLLFAGASDYTVSGGTLASNTATNSDLIVHQFGAGTLTISSSIVNGAGASTLTKAGTGTLVLGSSNTFTGAIFINAGTLSVSNNNQLGATATAAITINDGATFKTTADVNTGTHTFALTGGNATFNIANATTLTVAGVISGAGGLTLANTGTLRLNAAATLTGPVFVGTGATLLGGVTTFINSAAGGSLHVDSGGVVSMNDFTLTVGGISGAGSINNNGGTAARVLTVGGNNLSTTFSGVLSATSPAFLALTKNGSGVLTLTNNNTYTGATLLNYGTIKFGANNALAATAVTLMNASGSGIIPALLDLDGFNWTSGAITFYGTSSTAVSQASINIGTGGTLTLGGNVAATVHATPANGFQPASILGGTLNLGTASRTFTIADSVNAAVDLTVTSAITSPGGAFGITKAGAGTLLLTGANTYTGATVVNGANGILALGGAGTLGVGTNTLTMTAGILDLNGTSQSVGTFSGVAGAIIRNSAAGTLSTLSISNGSAASGSYAGALIDGGGTLALEKNGGSTITLTGANSYTGGTQVNTGTLVFGNTSAKPAAGMTEVASGALLGLGVGGAGFFGVADLDSFFSNTLANVSLAADVPVGIDTTAGDFDYTTSQSATRGLVKLGSNVLTLSGANTYTGGTSVLNGTLAISSDTNLGAVTSALTLGTGTTLRITGTSNTSWNTSRTLNMPGAFTLDIADAAKNYTLGIPSITLNGALTKAGAGVLKLSGSVTGGANAINVNGGVLQIDGSVATTGTTGVGNAASAQGLLRVPTGGSFSTANLNLGNNATGVGALVVSGGAATVTSGGTGVGLFLGNSGYGGLFVSSGSTLNTGRIETSTSTAATAFAVIQQAGGTINNSEYFLMRNNRFSVVITDGTLNHGGATQNLALAYQGAATSFGDFTVAGGQVINTGRNVTFGQVASTAALGTGVLNLNAGTLRTNQIQAYNAAGTATTAVVNFSGGTLQAATTTTDFIGFNGTGGATTLTLRSYGAFGAYAGGAVIDSNGFNITLTQPLVAPTGNGVAALALGTVGSGYIGAPYVGISGGGGTGATGYATVDLDPASPTYGQVTGVVLTNPGVGYTSTPTVTLTGGGGSGASVSATGIVVNTSGGLTKTGAGTLILSGANTYTGVTTVTTGMLQLAKKVSLYNNTPASWTAGNIVVNSGATLAFNVGGAGEFTSSDLDILLGLGSGSGGLLSGARVGIDTSNAVGGSFTYGGVIANPNGGVNVLSFLKQGAGTLVLSGANTFTGVVTLSAGTLSVGTLGNGGMASNLGAAGGAASNLVFDGGTLQYTGATSTTDRGFTINDGKTAVIDVTNAGTTLTFAGVVGANGALTKLGAGTLALTGAIGYTGATTLGQGGLKLDYSGSTPTNILSPTSTLVLGGGSVNFVGGAAAASQTVAATTLTAGTYSTISVAAGAGGFTLDLGTLTRNLNAGLNIDISGSPSVLLSGGTVVNGLAVGANGAAFLTVNGTDWGTFSGTTPVAASYTADTYAPGVNTDVTTFTGNPASFSTNTLRFNTGAGGTLTLAGANSLAAGGILVGSGSGAVILGGAGTIAGSAAGGTVAAPVNGELGIFQNSLSVMTISASILNHAGGISFLAATATGTTLNKNGPGILVLSAASNAWTGGTNIAGGTLRLGAANVLPNGIGSATSANVIIAPGSTLDLNGFSEVINGLGGAGVVDSSVAGSMTLTIGDNNATQAFTGVIRNTTGTVSVLKTGTGTQTLSGTSTYSGGTTVGRGTLLLNFTTAGAPASNILPVTGLTLGSGTLNVTGATLPVSQSFSGTTLAGGGFITVAGTTPNVTLNLGAITRSAGSTVAFNLGTNSTGGVTTTTANAGTSILGGWAVAGTTVPTGWAVSGGNGTTPGAITALATYLTTTTAGNTAANYLTTSNVDVTSSPTIAAAITINSLRFNTAGASTLTLTGTAAAPNVINSGGILVTATVGSANQVIGGTGTGGAGGNIIAPAGGELIIHNYNTNTNKTLTINSTIGSTGVNNFGLTIMGTTGTVALRVATNTYTGQTVINGGILNIDANERVISSSGITLNGGTLTHADNFSMDRPLTLGLGGGTLSYGAFDGNGGWSNTTPVAFLGSGPRTLTFTGDTDGRLATLAAAVGDGGGPTSLVYNGGATDAFLVLNPTGASTYSGTTTISLGTLRVSTASAIGGGLLAGADRGNIIFTATGTNRAILELSGTAGPVTRSVGYGPGQIHWEGNGGFSNNLAATQVVNLGGVGGVLTWGVGGFVPTGQRLQFGQGSKNLNFGLGTIDFQNAIELGTSLRGIEALRANGTTTDRSTAILEAILSGNITSGVGGGLEKVGTGTLMLAGANSGGPGTVSVTAGTLYFTHADAILGTGANITLSTLTGGNAAIGMAGDTNPIATLGGRIANPSAATAAFLLAADSGATLDFSSYPNMRLGALGFQGAFGTPAPLAHAVTFTGTIIPASGSYRLGGQAPVQGVTASAASTLVLGRQNMLTGSSSVNMTYGALTLTSANDYTGGTVVSGNGITVAVVGIGNDSVFGTGLVTLTGANNVVFGAVNGDHLVSNNIAFGSGVGGFVAGGDGASDGILANVNQGSLSYLGTIDMAGRTNPAFTSRIRSTLFLGDVTGGASGLNFLQTVMGTLSFLSTSANGGVAKSYSGTTTFDDNTTFVFDHNNSFGTGGAIVAETSAFYLQPGTTSVTLSADRAITMVAANTLTFNTPAGSALTLLGAIDGATTGGLNKSGLGLLVLAAQSPTATTTGTLLVGAGTLRLDAAAASGTVWGVAGQPLTLGTASGTFGNGGTLEITGTYAQSFGAVSVTARANTIRLTGNMPLTLGTVTRSAVGGTLNFDVGSSGVTSITSTAVSLSGLVSGGVTWMDSTGIDWAAASGTAITKYTAYAPLTGTASAPTVTNVPAANYLISSSTTNDIKLAATGTIGINTLKFSDTASRTIDIRSGTTAGVLRLGGGSTTTGVTEAGGILVAPGAGALTIGLAATPGTLSVGSTTSNSTGDLIFLNYSANAVTVNATIANNGSGAPAVVNSGPGKVILAGANTWTGALIINSGILEVASVNAASANGPLGRSTAGSGNILLNGGTFRANLAADGATDHGFTVNAPSILEVVSNTLTINSTVVGVISTFQQNGVLNAGNLKKTGAGTLELKDLATNANNLNLSIEIVAGTLILNKSTTAAISAVDLAGGAALIIGSAASGPAPKVVIAGSGGNQISDASSVVVRGDGAVKGVLDLNGRSETFDGLAGSGIVTTTVAGGVILTLGGNNSAGLSAYNLAAAAAGVNATGLNNFLGTLSDGAGTLALTKVGSGTQILGAAQSYSGATLISAGTLKLAVSNALPSGAGKSDITLEGNNAGVAIGGSGLVLAPGTLDMGGFDQAINGLNSSTGGFVTSSPILSWNGSAWVAAASTNTLTVGNNNATASFDGVIQDGFTVAPGITASGYAGIINLVKAGTGTQTLKGPNTYGGSTAIRNGAVVITGGNNRLPTGTTVILGSGADSGLFQVGDSGGALSQTIAGLVTSGTGTTNAVVGGSAGNSSLILNQTGAGVFSGAIGGAGANQNHLSLTLQGGGTLTLNGALTLTGATTVRQGSTLILDSDLPNSAISLGGSVGGTLISNNTLGGLLTVNGGGVVAPGNTAASEVGTLTLQGGLTLNNGGTLALQIGSTAGSSPRLGDLIMVTGGLFTIDGGEISLAELGSPNNVLLGTYDLINYAGAANAAAFAAGGGFGNLSLASSVIGINNYFVVLNHDAVNHLIQVIVDNARFWSGATDGQWNTTVANWSPANFFVNGDKVIFQDSYPTNAGNFAVVNSNVVLDAIVTPAAISFNNSAVNYTLGGGGAITGSTGLSKSGTGGLIISNANTFAGQTIISGGYIEMQNAAALGTTGAIAVSQGGAALRLSGGIAVGGKPLSLIGSGIGNGGALRNISGNNSYAGAITLNADARINSDSGTLTLGGGIINGSNALSLGGAGDITSTGVIGGGDGSVTVDGSGIVTLANNASTYSGRTFIKSGTLSVSKIGSVGVAGGLGAPATAGEATISIGNGASTGTLRWTGAANESSNRAIDLVGTSGGAVLDASGTGGAALTLTGSVAVSGAGSKTLTLTGTGGTLGAPNILSGAIGDPSSGSTSLIKTGTGVWRLDGGGSHTGSTTVNGGTLMLGLSEGMPLTAPVIANGSGSATLDLNGHTQTLNGIIFGGPGATGAAQGTVALGTASTLKLGGNVSYLATGAPLGASITGSGAATLDLGGAPDEEVGAINRTFNIASSPHSGGADLLISAVIADAGGIASGFANGIVKSGAGTLVLTGANNYLGSTTVDGGVLSVNAAALGTTGLVNVGAGSTAGQLNFYADNTAAAVVLAPNANLNVGGASAAGTLGFQLSGTSGSDTLTLSGTGVLTVGTGGGVVNVRALGALTGTSYVLIDATNTGPTTITGFTLGVLTGGRTYALDNSTDGLLKLTVGAAAAGPYYWNGSLSGSWATLGSGGGSTNWRLNPNGTGEAGATPGGVVVNFTTDTAANVSTTLDQPYAITGLNFLSNGSGTGNVTIAAGSGDGALTIGAGGIDVQTGASSSATLITAPVILGAAQTWNVSDPGKTLTLSGVVSGGGLLTKTGAGTLVLSGVNTYNGGIVLDGGIVKINHAGSLGDAVGDVTINAATLQTTADLTERRNVVLGSVSSTLQVDGAAALSLINTASTRVSGTGTLNATGAGILELDDTLNANTYSGGSVLGGGTVRIHTATGLGSGALTINAATLRVSGSFADTRNLTLGSSSSTLSIDIGRTLSILNSGSTKITGAGTLNVSGGGTLVLNDSANANDFTGGSVLSGGGTVRITTATSLGAAGGSVTIANASLHATQNISSSRGVVLGHVQSTLLVDATKTYQIINTATSNISGTGRLNVTGGGTLVLDDTLNANTFSGGSVIDGGGTVRITTGSSLGASSGAVTINNATLQAAQNISSTRNFLLGSYGSKVLVDAGRTYSLNGTLGDGAQMGTLNKLGGGTLVLSGANTYTGGTSVTAGTLLVTNATGSGTGVGSVSVTGAGTTLGGTGTLSGTVTLGAGTILAPGTSVGTLAMGELILGAGAVLNYDLGPVSGSDKTIVTGANGFTANGGVFHLTALSGFTNGTYNLITYAGTLGGSFASLSLDSSYLTDQAGNVFFAQLVNNPGSVDLISTSGLVWNGNVAGAIWDHGPTANANWQSGTATGINFYNTMAATFDDAATSFTVNIPGMVTPSSVTINAANDYAFLGSGAISGTTGLTKSGGGAVTLSNANTFSGNVLLSAGSVEMRDPAALGTGTISITAGASLRLNASSAITLGTRIVSIGGGGALVNVSGSNSATLPASLTAATSFISESGTLTLAGAVTSSSLALSLLGNGNITLTGASINIANAVFTVNTGGTVNVAGTIATGTSGVVISGPGTTILNGAITSTSTSAAGLNVTNSGTNTFGGNVSVNGTAGGITLNQSGGMTTFSGTVTTNTGGLTITNSSTAVFNGATITTNNGSVLVSGAAAATINSAIVGGTGGLTMSSTDLLILNGANTYAGTTTLNSAAGTLRITGSNNSAGATTLTAGTLQLGNASNGGLASGTLTLTSGTLQALNAARTLSNNVLLTAVTVSGSQSLTLNGSLTNNGGNRTLTNNLTAGLLTVGGAVYLSEVSGTGRTLTISGTGSTTINGVISDFNGAGAAGSLVSASSGLTIFGASNTYTGSTSLNDGILRLTAAQTMAGALQFGSLATTSTAGKLEVKQNATFSSLLVQTNSLINTSRLEIDTGRALATDGNVVIGSGHTTLSNTLFSATGGGTWSVNNPAAGGTFRVGGSNAAGNVTVADLSGLETLAVTLNSGDGVFRVASTSTSAVNGTYSTLSLARNATITAATLAVGDSGQNNGGPGQINSLYLGAGATVFNVNTLNIGATNSDLGRVLFAGSTGTLTVNNAAGAGRATVNIGTGQTTGSAATESNVFDVSGHNASLLLGVVSMGSSNRGASHSNVFSFDTGTLDMTSLNLSTRTADSVSGAGQARDTTSTVSLGGGTVSIENGVTAMAAAAGAYGTNPAPNMTAVINISGGTVSIGATGGVSITMGSYTATGGAGTSSAVATVNLTGGTTSMAGNITKGGTSGLINASVILNGGTLDMNSKFIGSFGAGTINFAAESGTLRNLGELNGGEALTKTTVGTLILEGTNTYTGGTTISGGVLQVGSGSISGTLGSGAVTNHATLMFNRSDSYVASQIITGTGNVVQAGPGTTILGGANTYTGKTSVTAGKLSISSEANLGGNPGVATADHLLLNGGTLQTTATLTLDDSNRGITVGTAGGKFETDAGTVTTIASVITGNGAITKEGGGTLLYTAVNTNTGSTTVNAGVLGGTGTVGGSVIVNAGGSLAPGASVGTLTVTGNLVINTSGILSLELGGRTFNAAEIVMNEMNANGNLNAFVGSLPSTDWEGYISGTTAHDHLQINGGTASAIHGAVKLSALVGGYEPAYGDIFDLLDWSFSGSLSGTPSYDFSSVSLVSGLAFNTDLFATHGIIVVVPEPSKALILLLGLLGLMLRRRRR